MKPYTESLLRCTLDQYRTTTSEGSWITSLNPDNIQLEFISMRKQLSVGFGTHLIYFNRTTQAKELFPYYIKALWHIKQKREYRWKYWLYKVFYPSRVNSPADEKAELAANWLYN